MIFYNKKSKTRSTFNLVIAVFQFVTMTPLQGKLNPQLGLSVQENQEYKEELKQITRPLPFDFISPSVIYGKDNRYETEDYPDRLFREKAKSVAGIVDRTKLFKDWSNPEMNYLTFFRKTARRAHYLCDTERFSHQNVLPNCTAFLIAPDVMVTAGHCIRDISDCRSKTFVFDYVKGTETIPRKNTANCKEIIEHELDTTLLSLKDFTVVRLESPVKDREPLRVRVKGRPNWGEDLVVIGHPTGLPQKIADGAEVKGTRFGSIQKKDYFMANLDTFAGNSGSPVFNKETGLVEGLLIEGAEDWTEDPDFLCKRAVIKKDSAFATEEKIFRINKIKSVMELVEAL